jgi:hypothetical protein
MVKERSFFLGLVAGAGIYIAVFVSFSLLPILGLAPGWLMLDYAFAREERALTDLVRPALGTLVGVAVMWIGAAVLFGYSPLIRYSAAFELHRALKEFEVSAGSLLYYLILNNLDFLMWSGAAMLILLAYGTLRQVGEATRGRPSAMGALAGAYGLTFIGVNLLGQTRGEVGRIWIYLLPLGAVIASREAVRLLRTPLESFQFVFLLEYVTACVIFFRTG